MRGLTLKMGDNTTSNSDQVFEWNGKMALVPTLARQLRVLLMRSFIRNMFSLVPNRRQYVT